VPETAGMGHAHGPQPIEGCGQFGDLGGVEQVSHHRVAVAMKMGDMVGWHGLGPVLLPGASIA
jgi:hypothetical protein